MTIDYKVAYSDRKTIGITVERDRKVVVRVPRQASDQAVSEAIAKKRFWIWQKLRDPRKYPDPPSRKEYVAGETFLFLGQHYGLALTEGHAGKVRLVGRQFEIAHTDRHIGDRLFRAWYVLQAKELLPPRIAAFAGAMGVTYKRIWIRDLKYRWGSCTPGGTLAFNWRILQAPMIVVNCLIVHELAHVLEPNHSQGFRNLVAVHAPSSGKARTWLKQNGWRLDW
jgi:predicted metal-dependent hydrolase